MKNHTSEEAFNIKLLIQSIGGVMQMGDLFAFGLVLMMDQLTIIVNIVQKRELVIQGLALRMDLLMRLVVLWESTALPPSQHRL